MAQHILSCDKHPLNKEKSVMADNGKKYLRIYGEGVIDRIHFDMLKKEIRMLIMDEIIIEEGVQLPISSKYLFYTQSYRIEIYKNIDVSNIMDATCMFSSTSNANPDTSLWELNPKCIVTDMFKDAAAYTGRDLEKEHEKYAPRFKILKTDDWGIDKKLMHNFQLTVQEINSGITFRVLVDKYYLEGKERLRPKLLEQFKIAEFMAQRKETLTPLDLENDIL